MFTCWNRKDALTYFGHNDDNVVKKLPGGMYHLGINSFTGAPFVQKMPIRKDKIYHFKHGLLPAIVNEFDTFWKSREKYKSLGLTHKRSILLHGSHGCGKTGIISALIEKAIASDAFVFESSHVLNFASTMPLLRQIEPDRPILAVVEDIDQLCMNGYEEALLNILDGASTLGDGIMFVSTTNKLNNIPPRLRCRPSRIDTLQLVGLPDFELRYEYFQHLNEEAGYAIENSVIKEWTKQTKGFSLAILKEVMISVRIFNKTIEETIERMADLIASEGLKPDSHEDDDDGYDDDQDDMAADLEYVAPAPAN